MSQIIPPNQMMRVFLKDGRPSFDVPHSKHNVDLYNKILGDAVLKIIVLNPDNESGKKVELPKQPPTITLTEQELNERIAKAVLENRTGMTDQPIEYVQPTFHAPVTAEKPPYEGKKRGPKKKTQ